MFEQLSGVIFRTIVGTAAGRAIGYVRARLIGDDRRREFVDALQAATQRLGQDYPALGQISVEIDFFADAEVVDALLAFVQPSGKVDWNALARRFRERYDTSAGSSRWAAARPWLPCTSMTAPTYTTSPWTVWPSGSHGGTRRRLAREPADRAGRPWASDC